MINNTHKVTQFNFNYGSYNGDTDDWLVQFMDHFEDLFDHNGRENIEFLFDHEGEDSIKVIALNLTEKFKQAANNHKTKIIAFGGYETYFIKFFVSSTLYAVGVLSQNDMYGKKHNFTVVGKADLLTDLIQIIKTMDNVSLINKSLGEVSWTYRGEGGRRQEQSVQVNEPHKVNQVLYPWLNVPFDEYVKKFFSSEANIMLMIGPPGTGKTNFIRNMIYQFKRKSLITYDESLLREDSMFVEFLLGKRHNMLIVEDADNMIQSREQTVDNMVSKFLNIGDGLIKFTDKKMIFSANLTDYNKVDSALLRPGRCFDALTFRKLTRAEAEAVKDFYNLPALDNSKTEFTLAEIFNPKNDLTSAATTVTKMKVGFR